MNKTDEAELRRLCKHLRQINERANLSSAESEALKKAALALHRAFISGLRAEVERDFVQSDQMPTEQEHAYLRSLGLDPESDA